MKNALILMLAGAIVGAAVASFIVPPMLSWYTEPGGLPKGAQVQAVVQIPEVVRYVTSRLLWGQAIGGVIGAVLGLMMSFMFSRKKAGVGRVTPT
jgi:hypothetical protein